MAHNITHPDYLKAKQIIKEFENKRDSLRNKRSLDKSFIHSTTETEMLWHLKCSLNKLLYEIRNTSEKHPNLIDVLDSVYKIPIQRLRESIISRRISIYKQSILTAPLATEKI